MQMICLHRQTRVKGSWVTCFENQRQRVNISLFLLFLNINSTIKNETDEIKCFKKNFIQNTRDVNNMYLLNVFLLSSVILICFVFVCYCQHEDKHTLYKWIECNWIHSVISHCTICESLIRTCEFPFKWCTSSNTMTSL